MPQSGPILDTIDSIRESRLFEWTFAISVANLAIQVYRLIAQLTTFLFDLFKLSYGVDLFWPLTTDDLRPYTHYFLNQEDTLYKLLESLVLSFGAFYGANCVLEYSIIGLIIYALLFFIHSVISILGLFFVIDHKVSLFSLEFLTWFATVAIEGAAVALSAIFLSRYGTLSGLTN